MLRLTSFCTKSIRQTNTFHRKVVYRELGNNGTGIVKPSSSTKRNIFQLCAMYLKGTKVPNSTKVHCMIGTSILGAGVYSFWPAAAQCKELPGDHEASSRLVHKPVVCKDETRFDWATLWTLLKPDRIWLLAAISAAMVVAGLNTLIPQVLGDLVNVLAKISENPSNFYDLIKGPGLKLVGLYSAQALFTFIYIWLLSGIGERLAQNMRQQLFYAIIQQDMSFFDRERTGELMNRVMSDVQEFKSAFKQCVSQGLRSGTQVIGCTCALVCVSPEMTLLLSIVVPTVIGLGTYLGSWLRAMSKEAQSQSLRVAMLADEAFSNIRTVRAFAMEEQESELLKREVNIMRKLNERLGFNIALFQAGTNLFLNGMVLSTLWLGGHLLSIGTLTPGDLMAFLVASQTIQRSLSQLSLMYGTALRGLTAGSAVFEYMRLTPSVALTGGKRIPHHQLIPNVVFKDVTFSYPTRSEQVVLNNFNLTIPAGKTVAIVGSSGNGKSTVASLLARMYDIEKGSISLGGHDLRQLDPSWLRSKVIGVINQEPVLFASTVKENIRYAKPSATDEEVYHAARLAGADDFIRQFPDGYNTLVGEKGVAVSGGQKQRIAIARALLKNPTVLIMDEATSALDSESEKMVLQTLESASKGRTVLVIAHRLSTVKNADLIVVLQQGTVVESGTHSELYKQKGHYWTLIQHQDMADRVRA